MEKGKEGKVFEYFEILQRYKTVCELKFSLLFNQEDNSREEESKKMDIQKRVQDTIFLICTARQK